MEPKLFLRKGVFYGNDDLIFREEIYLFLLNFINYKMLLNDTKITCNSFFHHFFNIPTHAPIIYTLKSTKFILKQLKTFKICPYMFRSIFKTIFRGLVDSALCGY